MLTKNLYIICGPSGSGKTTLVNVLEQLGYSKAVTTTTRERRVGEDFNAYHFVSVAEFAKGILHDEFAEYANYGGNYYGSALAELNKSCFVVLEPCGVRAVREVYKERSVKVIGLYAELMVLESRMAHESAARRQRLKQDIFDFQDLKSFSDLYIHTVAPLATLRRVFQYLRDCGEVITPKAQRYLSSIQCGECPD